MGFKNLALYAIYKRYTYVINLHKSWKQRDEKRKNQMNSNKIITEQSNSKKEFWES